ncbi:SpoIIE family protein phosphatase [Streptomyces spiralis]|uniref:SpoIIE family protein phosphatase n=1 Tax=Streptomyces spiralis TaxID=66376 RepID=UPI001672BBF4
MECAFAVCSWGGLAAQRPRPHPGSEQSRNPAGHHRTSEDQYRVETFVFETGDILLLYTGGVIEPPDPHGTFYPLTKWIAAWDGAGGPEHLVRCDGPAPGTTGEPVS